MKAAAMTLAGINPANLEQYRGDILQLMAALKVNLAVLPAYTSFFLYCATENLDEVAGYGEGLKRFRDDCERWNKSFLQVHGSLASELGIYLVAGTTLEKWNGLFYHTAFCFNPGGEICGFQRQTHLSREERERGWSRGTELSPVNLNGMKMGIVISTDARHPEVGRILALQGADLIAHTGALESGFNCASQKAGIWSQVQQNQFWAVESQFCGSICGRRFAAESAILGPCEITADLSGYLARGLPEQEAVFAELREEDRLKIKKSYPILDFLNPTAYSSLYEQPDPG